MIPLPHPSPYSKRHVHHFSRFSGLMIVIDRQTDRPTERPTWLSPFHKQTASLFTSPTTVTWQGGSQEHISSTMNTITLILHFPFFKHNRSMALFLISFPFTTYIAIADRPWVTSSAVALKPQMLQSCTRDHVIITSHGENGKWLQRPLHPRNNDNMWLYYTNNNYIAIIRILHLAILWQWSFTFRSPISKTIESETLSRTNVVAGLKSMRSEDTSYTTVKPCCTTSTILNDNDGTTTPIVVVVVIIIITFRVSRRRREMYCGHARLCVCVCVCVYLSVCP